MEQQLPKDILQKPKESVAETSKSLSLQIFLEPSQPTAGTRELIEPFQEPELFKFSFSETL